MTSTAMYRLPHADHYTRLTQREGEPETIGSLPSLNGRSGFVIAPFAPSEDCPILLLRPDEERTLPLPVSLPASATILSDTTDTDERHRYTTDFARFHTALTDGQFRKLVLSRTHRLTIATPVDREETDDETLTAVFLRACDLYPHQYVALFSTPQSGTWLVATPEILVEGTGNTYTTMALAGTMSIPTGTAESGIIWSDKNREEQHIVEDYIQACINRWSDTQEKHGPYTARAGQLVHLRTDFRFTLADTRHLGDLLASLHPTPAVCGLPKQEAATFILDHESEHRRYYSGFCGPLAPGGQTHLYVTLRCMSIDGNVCTLHAGGGLLGESTEQSEWDETEAKMETMRNVLRL